MGRQGYVPLRRLGGVPLRCHWVFHLRLVCLRRPGGVLTTRRCDVLLRRRYEVPIRCRGDVPLRRLGDVPSRRLGCFI